MAGGPAPGSLLAPSCTINEHTASGTLNLLGTDKASQWAVRGCFQVSLGPWAREQTAGTVAQSPDK